MVLVKQLLNITFQKEMVLLRLGFWGYICEFTDYWHRHVLKARQRMRFPEEDKDGESWNFINLNFILGINWWKKDVSALTAFLPWGPRVYIKGRTKKARREKGEKSTVRGEISYRQTDWLWNEQLEEDFNCARSCLDAEVSFGFVYKVIIDDSGKRGFRKLLMKLQWVKRG